MSQTAPNHLPLGYCVAQIRAVFSLPVKARDSLFPRNYDGAKHLAYVEWFSPFAGAADPNHLMYKITRSVTASTGRRVFEIIPVDQIRRSIHLFPVFGAVTPRDWTSANVLERCDRFYVSSFTDRHTYITIY
ncbi:hypothetical protein FA95DRAFT_1506122 [Auriscalpium vulgare]|uniref:Uncharacterized protein n=1 Tax=Auriscalpium vulgare TaxID=40419 RepID=A0ACB8R2A6_9AGAM|nr:hypothetical protein FA95DRAFT_1506122 [Auriscalpium vulgare]